MKLLVDESSGAALARHLRTSHHDVVFVGDETPGLPDAQVLERAHTEGRILVTNDRDFGFLVFRQRRPHAGVLFLRLADDRSAMRIRVVDLVLEQHGTLLPSAFVGATERHVRIHPT